MPDKPKWYRSKGAWISTAFGAIFFILDLPGRIRQVTEFYRVAPAVFTELRPYFRYFWLAAFLLALFLFEMEHRRGTVEKKAVESKSPFGKLVPVDPPPQERKFPVIEFVQGRRIKVEEDKGKLIEARYESSRFSDALIAQFKNVPTKTPGLSTLEARSVVATLVFSTQAGDSLHIGRGMWLGQYSAMMDFDSGEVHELLIGFARDGRWMTLDNPCDGVNYDRATVRKLFDSGLVEITLIDSRNTTVFNDTFRFELGKDAVRIYKPSLKDV